MLGFTVVLPITVLRRLTVPLGMAVPLVLSAALGLMAATAEAAPSPRDELDDLVAEARRLGTRNGASLAGEVLAELDLTIAEAQRQVAAGAAVPARRATERARGLLRLASATIARGKAEREATELHAAADARSEEATAVARAAEAAEADLARVEASLNQPAVLPEGSSTSPRPGAASISGTAGAATGSMALQPPPGTATPPGSNAATPPATADSIPPKTAVPR